MDVSHLDERARRKDTWAPSPVWLDLSNGQRWALPPVEDIATTLQAGGGSRDVMRDWVETMGNPHLMVDQWLDSLTSFTAHCLLINYALDLTEATALIPFNLRGQVGEAIRREAFIMGRPDRLHGVIDEALDVMKFFRSAVASDQPWEA